MLKEKRLQAVQATEKTLELLEILAAGSEELHIGELAERLDMSRNDVLLLLVTLESRGMVRWDERIKVYRPGWKSAELARQFLMVPAGADVDKMRATKPRKLVRAREKRLAATL